MNPLLIKPAIAAVIVAVASAVSFGAGWAVESWHKGAELEKVRGQNTVLTGANDKCAADVANARTAVEAVQKEAEERVRQAEAAMREAQPKIETRTAVITKIKTLPQVKPDAQCEAIKQEQAEYVAWRREL